MEANIRQVMFDNIWLQACVSTFDNTTKEFIANKIGYYSFQLNLVVKGAFIGGARLGVSKPYTGAKPVSAGMLYLPFFTRHL